MSRRAPPSSSRFWKVFNRLSALNARLYRLSGGRIGGTLPGSGGAPVILVHHVGKRTGKRRVSPLLGLRDGERWVIVASKGGTDKHPAWFHNLLAAPETEIEVGRRRIPVTARVVDEAERAELWPKLVAVYEPYDQYEESARGHRVIPVLSLDPR